MILDVSQPLVNGLAVVEIPVWQPQWPGLLPFYRYLLSFAEGNPSRETPV